jgi:CubicO group peptidase (beta-lactamase class C family)
VRNISVFWRAIISTFVLFPLLVNAQSAKLIYPGDSWNQASDAYETGWSATKLQAARAYSESINTAAVMVISGGVVVSEWGATTTKFNVHSIRKSLLSAMVGVYEEKGVLNLESTLQELGIDDRLGLSNGERQATLKNLLGSRSGIYHPSNLVGEEHSKTWPKRGSHAPGEFWYYSNWDFNATGAIFEQETGRGIFEAFDELVARPIGMQDYGPRDGMYEPRSGWGGAQGRSVSDFPAYVFRLTARDMARFGLLYLRGGQWSGQQIIPKEWIERTTRTDRPTGDFGGHEYFWWVSTEGRLYPGVDVGPGGFSANGAGGHYITIMPAYDLVVVHRVNTNDRTIPVGGTDHGTSVTSSEYGRLLALILAARSSSSGK